ncbi:MAG: ribosomal protein, partial [Chitinophagaceae bacterium]|nr:ribosomal protein [Chitinophagaceae bacterium]
MSENNIVNTNAESQEPVSEPVANTVAETTTATTNEPVEATPVAKWEPPVQTPHDDFDWSIDKRNVASYTKGEKEKYDKVYENTFVQ